MNRDKKNCERIDNGNKTSNRNGNTSKANSDSVSKRSTSTSQSNGGGGSVGGSKNSQLKREDIFYRMTEGTWPRRK